MSWTVSRVLQIWTSKLQKQCCSISAVHILQKVVNFCAENLFWLCFLKILPKTVSIACPIWASLTDWKNHTFFNSVWLSEHVVLFFDNSLSFSRHEMDFLGGGRFKKMWLRIVPLTAPGVEKSNHWIWAISVIRRWFPALWWIVEW